MCNCGWLRVCRRGYRENGNTYKGAWVINYMYGFGEFYNPTTNQRCPHDHYSLAASADENVPVSSS